MDVPLVEREPVAAQDSESLIGEFLAFAPLAGQEVIQAELQKRSDEMAARGCSGSNSSVQVSALALPDCIAVFAGR